MTFIVAEIGVNWDGDLKLLEDMMLNAKKAGADAVKLQAFQEDIIKEHPQRERLLKTSVTKSNILTINNLAKKIGIEWFCTPMFADAVDILDSFVTRYKISESDGRSLLENSTTELLEKVLATNKEVIISSEKNPKNSKFYKHGLIKWLYCVPKYPCEIHELDFKDLKYFNGYSNHYPHLLAPLAASILGADIIEIHITSDKNRDFIDNNVSLDYSELTELVKLIRLSDKIKK